MPARHPIRGSSQLLLTYKIGAVLGRTEALKTIRETDYTRAKLWKDLYDITSLLRSQAIESKTLQKFSKKSGIDKHTERFIEIIEARKDILDAHKLKKGYIKKKVFPSTQ